MNDDHGDQFPGALPAATPSRPAGAADRLVRMDPASASTVDSAVQTGPADLAHEPAEKTLVTASSAQAVDGASLDLRERRTAGRRSPDRPRDGRRPTSGSTLSRMGRLTRRSLDRFDRYTLDVFNPGHPYRPHADR